MLMQVKVEYLTVEAYAILGLKKVYAHLMESVEKAQSDSRRAGVRTECAKSALQEAADREWLAALRLGQAIETLESADRD